MSEAFKALRRLQNIRFEVKHRGNTKGPNEYKVKRIAFDPSLGELGACARTVKFEKTMPDGSKRTYSIAEYYAEQYKARIQHWYLPLIESTKGGFFPMEVCEVHRFNPYPFKLDPNQVRRLAEVPVLAHRD
jgi:eukaryotic translation initiation factor 2C